VILVLSLLIQGSFIIRLYSSQSRYVVVEGFCLGILLSFNEFIVHSDIKSIRTNSLGFVP
jgi:hypothetical protein